MKNDNNETDERVYTNIQVVKLTNYPYMMGKTRITFVDKTNFFIIECQSPTSISLNYQKAIIIDDNVSLINDDECLVGKLIEW